MDIDQHLTELTELRHHLHSIAEVSGREQKTAARVKQFLDSTDVDEIITGIGGNGILARFDGRVDKPRILLRCELDALPVKDKLDGADYTSQKEGVGHKCGHDGHMAILCGVAKALSDVKRPGGTVYLLFQPSEENGEGAGKVLNDSKFKDIAPDFCFALHNLPGFPRHEIVVRDDLFASASVGLTVKLKGATSHAASPEQGNSPALAMTHLINTFSATPEFQVPVGKTAKITVVHSILGKPAFGTSPGEATVLATLRTYNDELLEKLKEYCLQIVKGIASAYKLDYNYEFSEYFRATINHTEAVKAVVDAAGRVGYPLNEKKEPFAWSEDFGHFTKKYKGALFGLGAGVGHPSLHAESYDFPDEIIPTGVRMFLNIIQSLDE